MAAEHELLKQSALIDPESIYRESSKAFQALEALLGDDRFFFGAKAPGLFDASVFAYTNLILGVKLPGIRETKMMDGIQMSGCLHAHWDRINVGYFSSNHLDADF